MNYKFEILTILQDYFKQNVGFENAISVNSISDLLKSNRIFVNKRSIPTYICSLRKLGLPICFKKPFGYYFPKDNLDLLITINSLRSQIDTFQSTIKFLETFLSDYSFK